MNKDNFEHTIKFDVRAEEEDNKARQILLDVYNSLKEKGLERTRNVLLLYLGMPHGREDYYRSLETHL